MFIVFLVFWFLGVLMFLFGRLFIGIIWVFFFCLLFGILISLEVDLSFYCYEIGEGGGDGGFGIGILWVLY